MFAEVGGFTAGIVGVFFAHVLMRGCNHFSGILPHNVEIVLDRSRWSDDTVSFGIPLWLSDGSWASVSTVSCVRNGDITKKRAFCVQEKC